MGIAGFVGHAKRNSFGGQWLEKWKESGKIVVWLHRMVDPSMCWSHPFVSLDIVEDRDTGKPKSILRFPRFVSPDPEAVHRSQYFRHEDTDTLKIPPDRDAFLLLREWLRRADHLALEQPIFEWRNPKNNEVKTWTRGELSGLVKRSQRTFGNSLDTKLEYIFAVVQNDDPSAGVFLARETQLLGKRVAEVIAQRQEEHGDQGGDPQINPYAFVWSYDKTQKSPMDSYKVWKGDHQLTDAIEAAISSDNPPDPAEHTQLRDGDQEKIRAAMQDAAQVELPLDEIFSDDPAVRIEIAVGRPRTRPGAASRGGSSVRVPAGSARPAGQGAATGQRPQNGAQRQIVPASQQRSATTSTARLTSNARPAPTTNGAARTPPSQQPRPPVSAPGPASPTVGRTRRRKVEEPAPEPEPPPVETIPCEDCGHALAITADKCPGCGAEYDLELDEPAAADAETGEPDDFDPESETPAVDPSVCWSCKSPVNNDNKCSKCGIEQSDDVPF